MEKIYAVQVFYEARGGIRADKPLLYGSESMARKRGEVLAHDRYGVVVFEQVTDPDRDTCSEPMILAKYGHVPDLQCRE